MFTPLSREDVKSIVVLQFESIRKLLAEQGFELNATDEAIDWLSQLGYDPQFGARPLKRVLQKRILNELSKAILAGTIQKEHPILITLGAQNQFVFNNQ
jgi:ATP-dependent Clp protease ATP-binding subunit ClpB